VEVFGVVTPTRFGEAELRRFPNVRVVSPFGVGYDLIDCETLRRHGVFVTIAPDVSSRAVAELTLGCVLSLLRRIHETSHSVKSGSWDRLFGAHVWHSTLGIVGLGKIGKEVAKLALPLGMTVVANDLVYDEGFMQSHPGIRRVGFSALLAESDVVTLHVPLSDSTRHMIDGGALALAKRGMHLVNTARGPVVDVRALLEALESGQVGGAALDVYRTEPPFADPELMRLVHHPRVIATPHLGAVTRETHYAVAERIIKNVFAVADGRTTELDGVA
jgi:phosphoglycerate dehydrogenase-like enzyme